jgi:hypothetical protein
MDYLRRGIGMPEKVDRDFLEYLLPGIDGAVDTIRRFDPIHLAGRQLGVNARASIAKFDRQGVPTEHNRNPVPWVAVPRRSLAGRKAHPSNQRLSVPMQDFLEQGVDRFRGPVRGDAPKRKFIKRALRNAPAAAAASYISSPDLASL